VRRSTGSAGGVKEKAAAGGGGVEEDGRHRGALVRGGGQLPADGVAEQRRRADGSGAAARILKLSVVRSVCVRERGRGAWVFFWRS
jgi:hypothetical protein